MNMKKLLAILLLTSPCYAGLISHTDYISGAVITSAGQNSNENAIVNEFNGNIDNTNIKTGGIVDANIAAATITSDKLATTITSTFTTVSQLVAYRRPVLVYNSGSVVNIETGLDGTSGEALIIFPDGTIRKDSTAGRIQLNMGQTASLVATEQSGIQTGAVTNNTWYSVYAVKTTDNANNFVLVADKTNTPVQANFAALNTNFGTNGWVYLGTVRYGDNGSNAAAIVSFVQVGNKTVFTNVATGFQVVALQGVEISSTASATSLVYTYSAGMTAKQIPSYFTIAEYRGTANSGGSASSHFYSANGSILYSQGSGSLLFTANQEIQASIGVQLDNGSAIKMDILISGWVDSVLGVGSNPLL